MMIHTHTSPTQHGTVTHMIPLNTIPEYHNVSLVYGYRVIDSAIKIIKMVGWAPVTLPQDDTPYWTIVDVNNQVLKIDEKVMRNHAGIS